MGPILWRLKHFSTCLSLVNHRRPLHSYCGLRRVTSEKENAVFPFINVFHWQLTSRFHALCGICYGKKKDDMEANLEKIRKQKNVILLDLDGNHLGIKTKRTAQDLALDKELCIGLVDNSSELPTYQLMSREKFSEMRRAAIQEEKERKKKAKSNQPKTLNLKSVIEEKDLEIKLKSIDKWIDEGKLIKIVIKKPRNSVKVVTELSRKIVQYVQGRVIINKAEATDEYIVLSMKCKTDTQEHGTTVPPLFKHKDLQKLRSSVEEQNNGVQELPGKNE